MSTANFQQRYIAFVDILGFFNIVLRMSKEKQLFLTIRDSLKSLDRQSKRFRRYRKQINEKIKRRLIRFGSRSSDDGVFRLLCHIRS